MFFFPVSCIFLLGPSIKDLKIVEISNISEASIIVILIFPVLILPSLNFRQTPDLYGSRSSMRADFF